LGRIESAADRLYTPILADRRRRGPCRLGARPRLLHRLVDRTGPLLLGDLADELNEGCKWERR
jgi:hypothetical protein